MKLSVIVPVYNMASQNKLSYCMDSLVRQTHKDLEILAVDDCSTDESYAILKEYERRFPGRVRAFKSEVNHHQGGAKNIGLSHAVGDWIGFIDADDWVVPDFYERLLKKAQETGADCVGTDYSLVYSHTMTPGTVVHNNKLSQTGVLAEPMQMYPQVLENVRVQDKEEAQKHPAVLTAVDEVTKALGDTGRILLRASGTEPVVRVMVEAMDEDICRKYVDQVVEVMKENGLVL